MFVVDVLSSCPTLAMADNSYCVQLPTTSCEPSYQDATTITTTQEPETTPQPGTMGGLTPTHA